MKELEIIGGGVGAATEKVQILSDRLMLQVDGAGRYVVEASVDGDEWSSLMELSATCADHSRTVVVDLLAGAWLRVVCVSGAMERVVYGYDLAVSNEETREANEHDRVSAEAAREVAEDARREAEGEREANERLREQGEAGRVRAEAAREAAEGVREATFQTNEAAREAEFDAAIQAAKDNLVVVNDLTTGGADKALSAEMGKELDWRVDSVKGVKEAIFDFSSGSINAYSNRNIQYEFVKDNTYEIEVLTDDEIETYFSLRNEPSVALQNEICKGTGKRVSKFVASENASYLYMSLATIGTPIIYSVIIRNLSENNIAVLSKEINYLKPILTVDSKVPNVKDFSMGKGLSTKGVLYDTSDYCATEKYYTIYQGTTLRIRSNGYNSRVGICVYNAESLKFESHYAGDYSGDIVFDETKKVRFATALTKLYAFHAQVLNDTIDEALKKASYISKHVIDDFEVGNINITNTGWEYRDDNKNRVRLKKGTTYYFYAGDMIIMEDGIRVYVGRREGDIYTYHGWTTSLFSAPSDGEYVLLFALVDEHELYGKEEILSKVRILSNGGYYTHEGLPHNPTADDLPTMRVVNHRGYNSEAPENTESAYKLSKLRGYKYVETDVYFTSDGVPVILHDATIDRTSNGTGKISEMTYQEASSYDYGYPDKFGDKYKGEPLLTFDRFMLLCKTLGLIPYVELKSVPEGKEQTIVNIANKYGMTKCTTWISFKIDILRRIQQLLPNARFGYVGNISEDFIETALTLKNDSNDVFIDIQGTTVAEELILSARSKGLDVEMWNHGSIRNPLLPILDGITTDSAMLWEYKGVDSVWSGLY